MKVRNRVWGMHESPKRWSVVMAGWNKDYHKLISGTAIVFLFKIPNITVTFDNLLTAKTRLLNNSHWPYTPEWASAFLQAAQGCWQLVMRVIAQKKKMSLMVLWALSLMISAIPTNTLPTGALRHVGTPPCATAVSQPENHLGKWRSVFKSNFFC